ncbi:MAG: TetR/AcrR family transcriptional regulator [Candidatus Marinimicrobia bacterium]|nr:TetR/AcrR family transcriptional regulator [Candidatus Neomarinimicrobiota bacterium]
MKILKAAMDTFAKQGLEKGTIATIAREAGIGKGTIYQYFQSKEEIFEQIILVVFDEMFQAWMQLIQDDWDPVKKLKLIIDYTIDTTLDMAQSGNKEQFSMVMEIMLYAYRNNTKISLDKVLQHIYAIFEPIIEQGILKGLFKPVDVKYFSFILFSFLDGFGLHMFFQYRHYNNDELKRTMKSIILKGILL